VFNNVWAHLVCSPTRTLIIAGKHEVITGVLEVDNPIAKSETTLQKYSHNNKADTRATDLIGTWYLSEKIADPIIMKAVYYACILSG
jgi:arylsulfatase A-like enzyme